MFTDCVGQDLEVEVDTDLLEEVVADGDEADLDGDLEVLQPPELAEQVGDLLMDLGRVADDQADAQEERNDRSGRTLLRIDASSGTASRRTTEPLAEAIGRGDVLARAVLNAPGTRRDRRRDELNERRHINIGTLALGYLYVCAYRSLPRVDHRAHLSHCSGAVGRVRSSANIAGHRGHWVLLAPVRRHDQVRDVVGLGKHLGRAARAGDEQHLILNPVSQAQRAEQQLQGRLELDVVHGQRNGRRGRQALVVQSLGVEHDVQPRIILQERDGLAERLLVNVQGDRILELGLDGQHLGVFLDLEPGVHPQSFSG